jgi:hypothetical protein
VTADLYEAAQTRIIDTHERAVREVIRLERKQKTAAGRPE